MDVNGVCPYAEPIVHRVVNVRFPSYIPVQQVPVIVVVIDHEATRDPGFKPCPTDDLANYVDLWLFVSDFLASAMILYSSAPPPIVPVMLPSR